MNPSGVSFPPLKVYPLVGEFLLLLEVVVSYEEFFKVLVVGFDIVYDEANDRTMGSTNWANR